jgi:hypothetical protein
MTKNDILEDLVICPREIWSIKHDGLYHKLWGGCGWIGPLSSCKKDVSFHDYLCPACGVGVELYRLHKEEMLIVKRMYPNTFWYGLYPDLRDKFEAYEMGYLQLHKTWQELVDWTGVMANKYGGIVIEKHTFKQLDWGQALCRDLYGKNWHIDPDFLEVSSYPPEEPAPQYVLDRAREWKENGGMPDWVLGYHRA